MSFAFSYNAICFQDGSTLDIAGLFSIREKSLENITHHLLSRVVNKQLPSQRPVKLRQKSFHKLPNSRLRFLGGEKRTDNSFVSWWGSGLSTTSQSSSVKRVTLPSKYATENLDLQQRHFACGWSLSRDFHSVRESPAVLPHGIFEIMHFLTKERNQMGVGGPPLLLFNFQWWDLTPGQDVRLIVVKLTSRLRRERRAPPRAVTATVDGESQRTYCLKTTQTIHYTSENQQVRAKEQKCLFVNKAHFFAFIATPPQLPPRHNNDQKL